jgi:hypothetical protein
MGHAGSYVLTQHAPPPSPYHALPPGTMAPGPYGTVLDVDMLQGTANVARKIKTMNRPKSQFVGISSRQDGKFKAVVVFQGQSVFIGAFAREADAALHYDVVAAPLGKRVNDDARAKLIVERYPQETGSIADAVHSVDHAAVRQMAKHVANLFVRGTPGKM